ncbi:MAG: YesL family protein [Fusicatenibacter sp.]|nr:YesL family protein [Fusicatenibacter sp.]
MNIFSLDSKFSQVMGRVFDLMILNILFIVTSIPIFTIGASFTAMYYVTLKMAKNEDTYTARSYLKSFRQNFKQATAIWLILFAVLIILCLDLYLVVNMTGNITYLRYVFIVLLLVEGMILSYVFPVLSKFDNTVRQTIKNSVLMSIRHLPWTLLILLINLAPLLLYAFSSAKVASFMILAMLMLGFATVAYACSWFFANKIFPCYMPSEEEETLSEEEESARVLEALDAATPLSFRSDAEADQAAPEAAAAENSAAEVPETEVSDEVPDKEVSKEE